MTYLSATLPSRGVTDAKRGDAIEGAWLSRTNHDDSHDAPTLSPSRSRKENVKPVIALTTQLG